MIFPDPLRRFRRASAISSWMVFVVALFFYWITADPGVSYWDCPEYVTVASRMEVGHPPGNPIWMLAMRVATIPFPADYHAYVINLCSGLFMAFAAFFLCRIIFIPTRLFTDRSRSFLRFSSAEKDFLAALISFGGSLCFALCDSAWFSAVEAEVYAMSTFLSALSLWIMMKWWWEPSRNGRIRLLVLLCYITGISLGVHQLNLLLIPVFCLIILYRKYHKRRAPFFAPVWWIILSFALVGVILLGVMPGILFGAGKTELFAVNYLGLPYNWGGAFFFFLILAFFALVLSFSGRAKESGLAWGCAFLILGLSSFGMIMIRANAYPAMNEGMPDNFFSLASYISREQYPSSPLVYGATPYSRAVLKETYKDGEPQYLRYLLEKGSPRFRPYMQGAELNHRSGLTQNSDSLWNEEVETAGYGYLLTDYNFRQVLTPELNMWLPRITSGKSADLHAYQDWAGMTEKNMDRVQISEAVDSGGNFVSKISKNGEREDVFSYRPTYTQNLRFFWNYQVYYMYLRYLLWNFVGRQNDVPSQGEIEHGNILTGVGPFDAAFLGVTSAMPDEIGDGNRGRNRYFGIPFILGLIGICALAAYSKSSRRYLGVVAMLFLMTGLAIVVYLNQSPGEPRERDYTFLVSYLAFAIFIAAGMMSVISLWSGIFKPRFAILLAMIPALGVPALMAAENFDDHDRRGRFEPTFFASSFLDMEDPAIIFSHGDNSTFPLWYASEVLGMGPNHTTVDVTYLSLPEYVVNLKKQGKKGLTTLATTPQIAFGKYILTKLPPSNLSEPMDIKEALVALYSNETPEWPSSKIRIGIAPGDSIVINLRDFTKGSSFLPFKHLMLLDLLSSQSEGGLNSAESQKALFFPYLIGHDFYKPLASILKPALFGKIYQPGLTDSVALDRMEISLKRELGKLSKEYHKRGSLTDHYLDPLIADRVSRYRGELIIAANQFIEADRIVPAQSIADSLMKFYPYSEVLPGTFTVADSTFYEGKEFSLLLDKLQASTGQSRWHESKESLDSLLRSRRSEWTRYYHSLSPSQRSTLSPRSLRLLRIL